MLEWTIAKLAPSHEVTITYYMTVKKDVDEISNTTLVKSDPKKAQDKINTIPVQTGENSNMIVWLALVGSSLLGLAYMLKRQRKKRV